MTMHIPCNMSHSGENHTDTHTCTNHTHTLQICSPQNIWGYTHACKHTHAMSDLLVSTRVIINHWNINTSDADIYSCHLHSLSLSLKHTLTHTSGFIMTVVQANATRSMTEPLFLSLSSHYSDPKAAACCHAEPPAAFIPSLTEQ